MMAPTPTGTSLLDVSDDILETILEALSLQDSSNKFLAALACRRFRGLLAGKYKTRVRTVVQSVKLLEWARNIGDNFSYPWNELTCAFAARDGHLDVLKWARSQEPPCPWDEWTCSNAIHNAAQNGHLHVVEWVREHGCDG